MRPAADRDSSPNLREGWLWLCAAVLLVYARTTLHEFNNFDDTSYITRNAHVMGGLTWEGVRWAFFGNVLGMWHPLTGLSHMMDWQLFGAWAGGHLAVNLALHAFNAGLLFVVLRRMTGAGWPSFLVALLFAIHPLNVESVAWASQRKSTLSGTFFFLTLLAWHHYKAKKSVAGYGLALVAFALGLMSKPVLVTLPCLLLLLDLWPLSREKWTVRNVIQVLAEKIPFAALSVIATLILFKPSTVPADYVAEPGFTAQRWLRAMANMVVYLRRLVWPSDLAVLYPHRTEVAASELAIAVVILLALTALAWRSRWAVLVGWLWFLGLLFPMSGIMPIGPHEQADRYAYLSGIGVFIMVAWLIPSDFWVRPRRQIVTLVAAIGLIFGAVAWRQVGFWQNSLTLWARDVALYPPSMVQLGNYGNALADAGHLDAAEQCFQWVAEFDPKEPRAFVNIASIRNRRGDKAGAILSLERALKADPRHAGAHAQLGSILQDVGRTDEARKHLETAISLDPELGSAHLDFGVLLAQQGELSAAEKQFKVATRIMPEDRSAWQNLALVRQQLAAAAAKKQSADSAR